MEATRFSETLLTTYEMAHCHIPDVIFFTFTTGTSKSYNLFVLYFALFIYLFVYLSIYFPFYMTHRTGLLFA